MESNKVHPIEFQIEGVTLTHEWADEEPGSCFNVKSIPRSYQVRWDEDSLPGRSVLQVLNENPGSLLVIDENVFRLYRSELDSVPMERVVQIQATEEMKSLDGMLKVVDFMNKHRMTKGEKLVVVGGGITQDIGAFACAVFKRGIPWVFFPTTLLSQSDSCIGGKTGLNYQNAKNQLALISAPYEVIINPHFLKTLKPDAVLSGLGEVLKAHITGGSRLLARYETSIGLGRKLEPRALKRLIFGALGVKKAVIEKDEFELNIRKSLNYGHTFGHAIEALSHYEIPHGLSVVLGMILENELSCLLKLLTQEEKKRLNSLCFDLLTPDVLKIARKISFETVLDLFQRDKKTVKSDVAFILLHQIGNMRFFNLPLDSSLKDRVSQVKNCLQEQDSLL